MQLIALESDQSNAYNSAKYPTGPPFSDSSKNI